VTKARQPTDSSVKSNAQLVRLSRQNVDNNARTRKGCHRFRPCRPPAPTPLRLRSSSSCAQYRRPRAIREGRVLRTTAPWVRQFTAASHAPAFRRAAAASKAKRNGERPQRWRGHCEALLHALEIDNVRRRRCGGTKVLENPPRCFWPAFEAKREPTPQATTRFARTSV